MSTTPRSPWSHDATMRYLNSVPLPATFTWLHRDGGERAVRPVHAAVSGYGKWIRETPYFPGLFELAHHLLATAPEDFEVEWLPRELERARDRFKAEPARPCEHLAHKIRRLMPGADQPTLF
jgi:hypothetical protein